MDRVSFNSIYSLGVTELVVTVHPHLEPLVEIMVRLKTSIWKVLAELAVGLE